MDVRVVSVGASRKSLGFGRLKPRPIQKALADVLNQLWIDSAGIFAKELAREVLVQTGESAGSLEPLARFTRVVLRFRSAPDSNIKRPSLDLRGNPIKGTRRSFQTGVDKGRDAFTVEQISPTRYVFEFRIPVFQFALHDAGRGFFGATSMKGATDRAREKQEAFVRRQFQQRAGDLLAKWLVTGKVETRGSSG